MVVVVTPRAWRLWTRFFILGWLAIKWGFLYFGGNGNICLVLFGIKALEEGLRPLNYKQKAMGVLVLLEIRMALLVFKKMSGGECFI